ncbi:alginate lyase [Cryptococcus neoformans]|nr:alginate lyase [Cryptococcus neoformans var. grubii]
MSPFLTAAILSALLSFVPSPASAVTLESIIDAYGLSNAQYNFTWPDKALDSTDANEWIDDHWSLNGNKVDWGKSYIVFSADPSTTSSTLVRRQDPSTSSSTTSTSTRSAKTSSAVATASATSNGVSYPAVTDLSGEPPVLRIEYPSGSYSKKTGGTQFYAQPLNGSDSSGGALERMLLSYDIWFPSGFSWNKGGKLPGLRGGPETHGCSGGNATDGTSCFSTRLMWRTSGSGEVYAYIPTTQKGFCSENDVTCNSDYGTSLARGSFSFITGQWQTIYLMVILNEVGTANGVVQLWYNGVPAMTFTDLVIRTSSDITSVGGLYFSTFFGGDDSDWATPTQQFTYYKNIQLYGGVGASNLTGAAASSAGHKTAATDGMKSVGMGVVLGLIGVAAGLLL